MQFRVDMLIASFTRKCPNEKQVYLVGASLVKWEVGAHLIHLNYFASMIEPALCSILSANTSIHHINCLHVLLSDKKLLFFHGVAVEQKTNGYGSNSTKRKMG